MSNHNSHDRHLALSPSEVRTLLDVFLDADIRVGSEISKRANLARAGGPNYGTAALEADRDRFNALRAKIVAAYPAAAESWETEQD